MKGPQYTESGVQGVGATCSMCGCQVGDQDQHTSYHAAVLRVLGFEDDE